MVWPIAGNPCSIEAHGIRPDGRTVDHLDAKLQVRPLTLALDLINNYI